MFVRNNNKEGWMTIHERNFPKLRDNDDELIKNTIDKFWSKSFFYSRQANGASKG